MTLTPMVFLPLELWEEVPARLDRMRSIDPKHFLTLVCEAWAWMGRGYPAKAAEVAERARQLSASLEWEISVFSTNCTLALAYAAMARVVESRAAPPPTGAAMDRHEQLNPAGP